MREDKAGIAVLRAAIAVMVMMVPTGGCGDSAGNSRADAGATPADGGGVCCAYGTRCDCLGGGGWAASASACVPASSNCSADGHWHLETDGHGCQSVVTGTGPNCCGCNTLDASGEGATTDARTDSSCPANFCACTCQDGVAGYRPQCDPVGCTSSDPCISGLDADGGWLVCGL